MMQPPYTYACASLSWSSVASGKRSVRTRCIESAQTTSIIASWVSTEYPLALDGENATHRIAKPVAQAGVIFMVHANGQHVDCQSWFKEPWRATKQLALPDYAASGIARRNHY